MISAWLRTTGAVVEVVVAIAVVVVVLASVVVVAGATVVRVVITMGAAVVVAVVAVGVLLEDVVEDTAETVPVMVIAMEVEVLVEVEVEAELATVDEVEDCSGAFAVATDMLVVVVVEEADAGTVVGFTVVDGLPLTTLLLVATLAFVVTVGILTNTVLHTVLAFTFVHFCTFEKPLGIDMASTRVLPIPMPTTRLKVAVVMMHSICRANDWDSTQKSLALSASNRGRNAGCN